MKVPKKRLLVVVVIALCLSACATKLPPEGDTSFPEINAATTTGIGEPVLIQKHGILAPLLAISEDQAIGEFMIPKGKYIFEDQNKEEISFGNVAVGRGKKEEVLLKKDNKQICVDKVCSTLRYALETTTLETAGYFEQMLLYNGKIGDRITLGYREFSNQMARPAFSNDVIYDLSQSLILGYKGARIEVIKATNTEITYKLLSGFK